MGKPKRDQQTTHDPQWWAALIGGGIIIPLLILVTSRMPVMDDPSLRSTLLFIFSLLTLIYLTKLLIEALKQARESSLELDLEALELVEAYFIDDPQSIKEMQR
jgi:hypothetical protein